MLGHCHIGGSGSGKLLLAAESIVGAKHTEGGIRDVDEAINGALTFANQFLAEEMLAGLQETNFGGGFEIGTITTRGAEKVGDVLNLFWNYEPKKGPIPLLRPALIKWDYNVSDLVAQRLAFEQKQSGEFVTIAHTISVITPPDMKPIDRYPIPPDLNCRYLCNLYYRTYEDNTARAISSIFHAGTKKGPARFDLSDEGKTSLHFNRQHLEREWEIVRDALA